MDEGDVDIAPANEEKGDGSAMGAGDSTVWADPGIGESGPIEGVGGLSILSSGGEAGAAKAGCTLNPTASAQNNASTLLIALLVIGMLVSLRRHMRRGEPMCSPADLGQTHRSAPHMDDRLVKQKSDLHPKKNSD